MSSSYWKYKNSKSKQFSVNNHPNLLKQPPKKTINKWQYGKGLTKDKIKIASWNVNGIRSVLNRRYLQPYLQKQGIDILCINQTKIDQSAFQKAPITLHGYSGYWNFCKCSSGYSGVAIFSKFLPISMEEDLPQVKHCHEGRVIILEFQKFYLVSVYVPNSGSKLERLPYRVNEFDVDFMNHIQDLRKHKHVIVAGDMNVVRDQIDIYKSQGKVQMSQQMPACTLQQRNNFDKFIKLGYIDTFREMYPQKIQYTWWNMKIDARKRNIGWRIDYILLNQEMRQALINAVIQDKIPGSDHCPVQVCLDLSRIEAMPQNQQFIRDIIIDEQLDENSNQFLMMCSKLIQERKKNTEGQQEEKEQKNDCKLQKSKQQEKQQQNQKKQTQNQKQQKCSENLGNTQNVGNSKQKMESNQNCVSDQIEQKQYQQNQQQLQKTQKKAKKRQPIKFQSLYQQQQLTRTVK